VKRAVRYAASPEDLVRLIRGEIQHEGDELLLQEHVTGFGAGVFGLYDRGQPTYFFAHRRIREKPPSGGVSVLCESVPLPADALQASRALLDGLGWHGVAMVEFKVDAAGQSWLIEVNARFWGSLQLAVDCGADFPAFLYELAAGRAPSVPQAYVVGQRLRNWLGDFDNLYARVRSETWTPRFIDKLSAIGEFLWPWPQRTRYEMLRVNDPMPALSALRQYVGAMARV
jgi:predicted ATP-grasp superfamily ATP-dependent carboligase